MSKQAPRLATMNTSAGGELAYRLRPGSSPTLLFLPGYASDMDGAKALALDAFAAARGQAVLRFDYSGTGASGGRFGDASLAGWLGEAREVIDQLTNGPLILVGSSMGAWIALHLALQLPGRVQAMVGIAAAPDFTDWGFTAEEKAQLDARGSLQRARPGSDAPTMTRAFWASGQSLRLLETTIAVDCPVRLVHGEADEDVPLEIALRLMRQLRSADVQLTILKGGGHRLSEPREIDAILGTVAELLEPLQ